MTSDSITGFQTAPEHTQFKHSNTSINLHLMESMLSALPHKTNLVKNTIDNADYIINI